MFKAHGFETALPETAAHQREIQPEIIVVEERWAPRWAILLALSASLVLWAMIAILIF